MTIKINKLNNLYWYYPTIFTFSKRQWVGVAFKNLKELFTKIEIIDGNYRLSVNQTIAIETFNFAQQLKGYSLRLDKNFDFTNKNFYYKEKINDQISIVWTYKTLKKIIKGSIPFVSKQFLIKQFNSDQNNKLIKWTGLMFDWFKQKTNI